MVSRAGLEAHLRHFVIGPVVNAVAALNYDQRIDLIDALVPEVAAYVRNPIPDPSTPSAPSPVLGVEVSIAATPSGGVHEWITPPAADGAS